MIPETSLTDLPSIKDLTSYGVLLFAVVTVVRSLPKIIDRYMGGIAARETRTHDLVKLQIEAQDARHTRMLEQNAKESALDREACDRRSAEMTATICAHIAELTRKTP